MEKKLYWEVESNGDLSFICNNLEDLTNLVENDFDSLNEDEQEETQYTITPVWLTDEEYNELPED
jgi:hypothetical protein